MTHYSARAAVMAALAALALACKPAPVEKTTSASSVFNVRDYGAAGIKDGLDQEAIQKAIDACAAAGGGTVLFPPGRYTTGTLHLRSHVRLYLDGGAVVYAIHDKSRFDKEALLYGEDLVDVAIEGR